MIYAGDNSPDGNVFAIGGLMKFDTTDGPAIRLIDLGRVGQVVFCADIRMW
ncbi:MAG: hypothetical protein P1U68_18265 [Verrucomicrobiales bacterium]|nr:hypothetical protein [Verrucomicrobiales bacterium]